MSGSRRNKKRGSIKGARLGIPRNSNLSAKSAPLLNQAKDWPGVIDKAQVEDIRQRLNLLSKNTSTHMIKCFLSTNELKSRNAVEAIHQTTEFRKGHQMFYNHYRTLHPRNLLISGVKKCGRGMSSVFGKDKHGRLVVYEHIGQTFNQPFFKEFTAAEFANYAVVWCEALLQRALANTQNSTTYASEESGGAGGGQLQREKYIQYIPYYVDEARSLNHGRLTNGETHEVMAADAQIPMTPQFNTTEINEENEESFPETMAAGSASDGGGGGAAFKYYFPKPQTNNCNFSDVIVLLDWQGCDCAKFLRNKALLFAAEQVIGQHYPHLINRFYHLNMPLDFELVQNDDECRRFITGQTMAKSVFLETPEMREKRVAFMKLQKKQQKRRGRGGRAASNRLTKSKKTGKLAGAGAPDAEEEFAVQQKQMQRDIDRAPIEAQISSQLLDVISAENLPQTYGGHVADATVFQDIDPFLSSLIGLSNAPSSEYDNLYPDLGSSTNESKSGGRDQSRNKRSYGSHDESKSNSNNNNTGDVAGVHVTEKTVALKRGERHTERVDVKRGEHYHWTYNIDLSEQAFTFGLEFEASGFRGKTIKVIVREEHEDILGAYDMYGDFIVLKDGRLTFQYRNSNNGKRVQLRYSIRVSMFEQSFIQKYLPDYSAEESILQVEARGGRGGGANKRALSASSYTHSSGTSPDPINLAANSVDDNEHESNSGASASASTSKSGSKKRGQATPKTKTKRKKKSTKKTTST